MREKDYVVIIGSANIDVAGYSHESLNYADCRIRGKIKFTPGGVGRNIAQNCCWEQALATERSRQ